MKKRFTLDAGRHLGEAQRFSGNNIDEKIVDDLAEQIRATDAPEQEKALVARMYKHSMFAPHAIRLGDLNALRNRTPGVMRLGQGFEGIVEILSYQGVRSCIKRRYGIGDRKELPEHLRKRFSYGKEFEFQRRAFALDVTTPRPLQYAEITVKNSLGVKIGALSTEMLVMQAIPGRTLLDFDRGQVQDFDALEAAFRSLRRDLETLHNNGIYHGDLGLKNMMIVESLPGEEMTYTIYIIDFGRAYRATEDMFASGRVPGARTDDELYRHAYHRYFES